MGGAGVLVEGPHKRVILAWGRNGLIGRLILGSLSWRRVVVVPAAAVAS